MDHSEPNFPDEAGTACNFSAATLVALAEQIGLPLPEGQGDDVRDHWLKLAQMAHPLLTLPLPTLLDPAPRFEP